AAKLEAQLASVRAQLLAMEDEAPRPIGWRREGAGHARVIGVPRDRHEGKG
ncbi:unnamed protein product, partial [Prorocentrum cordatum]